jgi:hypothetical protein
MCCSAQDVNKFRPIFEKIVKNIPITKEEYDFCLSLDYPVEKLKVKTEENVLS